MPKYIVCTLAITALSLAGCRGTNVGPQEDEGVAPPDPFTVTTKIGARLTGPAARIDIRRVSEAHPPDVEITFSASGGSGRNWAAQLLAPPAFLDTLTLEAPVREGPLSTGEAAVQTSAAGAEVTAARAGRLRLAIAGGRLSGEASGMSDELSASFQGSFVVTCAAPAASLEVSAPSSGARSTPPTLVVDEKFESPLCKPYATLAGR
jgi:hypothetical protein